MVSGAALSACGRYGLREAQMQGKLIRDETDLSGRSLGLVPPEGCLRSPIPTGAHVCGRVAS